MKRLFIIFCFLFPAVLTAQEFNYVHYDTKDGLAGSTVYSMCQDKDGFMWFATENGLSRYDGTRFKNFTVKDGLPDNEVLKVFADSKGRVWIGTFSKEICFYYKGRICTKENDSLVKKIILNASINSITEDGNNFVGISTSSSLIIITPTDSVIKYNLSDFYKKKYTYGGFIVNHFGKLKIVNNKNEILEFDNTNLIWKSTLVWGVAIEKDIKIKLDSFSKSIYYSSFNNHSIDLIFPGKFMSTIVKNDNINYITTTDGAWSIDTFLLKRGNHFLPGKKISWIVEDKEKNLWFASLGEGVFKLPSEFVKTYQFSSNAKNSNDEVFSITEFNESVFAGMESNRVKLVDKNLKLQELNYKLDEMLTDVYVATNRLYSMISISDSTIVLGFDKFLVKLENGKSFINYISPVKSVEKINNKFIIVGTGGFAFKMRLKDLQITDTLWRERCTKVFYHNQHYYIGTLKGLYQVKEDKSFIYLGTLHPALSRRITDIKLAADSSLWISTSDNGIVAYKNGKVLKVITDQNGLSSNICKTLFIAGNALWAGTDKGINKINITNGAYAIIKYTITDGLPSNTINALYVKDSIVWVGSPAGLTYFNENSIANTSICNLKMLGVYVSGKLLKKDAAFTLSHKNNNVNFEYTAISFRSGGEMRYHYKLTGLDDDWRTTTENNLDYKSLPSGNYTLALYAVNKYNVKSDTITINFAVATPFWKTIWFYILMALVLVSTVVIIFNWRNTKTKKRLEEKNNFQKQFAVLEQQALQSQMNPHFIFNCLNSIQQYILTNNKEKANQYLTDFAALIRQTLDISSQKTISIATEASYLKKYLEMECMRFGNTFTYAIKLSADVEADYIQVPALLLQPYVENSLRHGIRYKTGGGGNIEISFSMQQDILYCSVKDNGIGRDKAKVFKSKQHIEYQSKGMHLTSKRIELLNAINERKITVNVTDLLNTDTTPAGTLVEIKIPV